MKSLATLCTEQVKIDALISYNVLSQRYIDT